MDLFHFDDWKIGVNNFRFALELSEEDPEHFCCIQTIQVYMNLVKCFPHCLDHLLPDFKVLITPSHGSSTDTSQGSVSKGLSRSLFSAQDSVENRVLQWKLIIHLRWNSCAMVGGTAFNWGTSFSDFNLLCNAGCLFHPLTLLQIRINILEHVLKWTYQQRECIAPHADKIKDQLRIPNRG